MLDGIFRGETDGSGGQRGRFGRGRKGREGGADPCEAPSRKQGEFHFSNRVLMPRKLRSPGTDANGCGLGLA